MKKILFPVLFLFVATMLASCDSGGTGNFKIKLRLPFDDGICEYHDDSEDNTYCIHETDQILLTTYTSATPSGEYVYSDRKLIRVKSDRGGKEEFVRSLKSGIYYRFFVEVTNANEKLKLTGGIDSILYEDNKNFEADIFLGAVGDFVRVIKKDGSNFSSLETYFDISYGSKGSGAASIKNGKLYLSGGYCFEKERVVADAMVFDLKNFSSKKAASLGIGVMDHTVSFLDDGSETGKVVIAFGSAEDGPINSIRIYDPDKDKYREIGYGDRITKAKSITIDGDVYIAGGCNKEAASQKVYRVYNKNKGTDLVADIVSEEYSTLKTGRCNHAIADVSYTKEDGAFVPRILIVGGSTDEDGRSPVKGDKFAEVVEASSSKQVTVTDRTGEDSSDLLNQGLISPGASAVVMDDLETPETVVAVVGGYLEDEKEDTKTFIPSPNLYVLSEKGDGEWIYDTNASPSECARPSMGTIGAVEKSVIKYAAVNCGAEHVSRNNSVEQVIFVVQVKRNFDKELGKDIFSASVKESLMDGNRDNEETVSIVDGPVAVNELGQAFIFGSQYIYQVSSYAVPN
ncbi:MAG: hypothetical protein ACOX2F_02470 [bacterium]